MGRPGVALAANPRRAHATNHHHPSPVLQKKYSTGDGMFFNWVFSLAILTVGMVVQMIECYKEADDGSTKCPAFEPLAMVGGAIWVRARRGRHVRLEGTRAAWCRSSLAP
jgi:hypothetical protein